MVTLAELMKEHRNKVTLNGTRIVLPHDYCIQVWLRVITNLKDKLRLVWLILTGKFINVSVNCNSGITSVYMDGKRVE